VVKIIKLIFVCALSGSCAGGAGDRGDFALFPSLEAALSIASSLEFLSFPVTQKRRGSRHSGGAARLRGAVGDPCGLRRRGGHQGEGYRANPALSMVLRV